MIYLLLPLLLVTSWNFALARDAAVYSYTDDQGTVYFSDERPEVNYEVTEISMRETFRQAVSKLSKSDLRALIQSSAEEYEVEASLVEAVIKAESEYDTMAISKRGARGLMQLMPATARSLGVRNLHDPKENIMGGVRYLRRLLDQFDGDVEMATAAYNAGEGAVAKYNGIPPYAETIDYVQKVKRYYNLFRERATRSASRDPAKTLSF
jgi:soluble lytic murein transglycosylase-like protein